VRVGDYERSGTRIATPAGMDSTSILNSLRDPALWWQIAFALSLGALGAVARRANEPGESMKSGDAIKAAAIGSVAGLGMLYVTDPNTLLKLISGALVAGYASKAVLVALEARTTAAVINQKAADTRTDLRMLADQVDVMPAAVAPTAPIGAYATVIGVQQLARTLKAKHPA